MKTKTLYAKEFAKKKFSGENMKDAYMKAVKWYASNVLAKDELHNILVEFEKDKQSPTVTIHLSAGLDEHEIMENHCTNCKEMHHSFFINEDTACNRCSAVAYERRMSQKVDIKVGYYKECLRRHTTLEEEE